MDCVACQVPLSFTISQSLLRFMSIEPVMLSNHLIIWHPLFLLPSIFPTIRVFSSESFLHISWPKPPGASASVLSMNIQGWFPLGLTCLISLLSKGLSRVFSSTTFGKNYHMTHQFQWPINSTTRNIPKRGESICPHWKFVYKCL